MNKRKICVVTGTRAEYGLLYWLMKEIEDDESFELQVAVTGMHLSPEFGLTYKMIEQDGFKIDEKIEMLLSSDTPVGIATSLGLGTIGFASAFERLKPDILVVLGDRFETMAAAQAAMIARIPIAHLYGGEVTEGAIDEAIRHSITKMAHYHFVSTDSYRRRVIQLGEHPDRVFNVGAIGLENICRMQLLTKTELEESIDFSLGEVNFLVTYHPVTLDRIGPKETMMELFAALDYFPDAKIIFTKPNSDTDGRIISQMIDEYVSKNPSRSIAFTSLGQLRYLSAIQHVDLVLGNSSSGIIEVPSFKKPTINLGNRQRGRLRTDSIIDCEEQRSSIINAIQLGISKEFQRKLQTFRSPYGEGDVSLKIIEILRKVDYKDSLMKSFFDLK
ncbi:UDP-N-acetylglucosamine 2-epimerase [Brevibacillus parabrevis]|uniref:UDP-N-acetylglucosamine 2-epimerase n=1 Tax=Brevibacillus parabrevis TaxID=54914 RepID=UPI00238092EE|nr:UDP-N-acetylglucosamine 2-epimerase [Brevibacillus parabrevis]MED2256170.1 UDP-N-acetylglucosamine 2-epimerase [Brevibacillus parabrevis]WDV94959.1 UDP-N-acetylglucosamine 2-epimerase [Brevibacillus parabrevis]